MNLKNNLFYLWEFYKWQIMGALALVILGLSFLSAHFLGKECALSVMLLDCYAQTDEQEMEEITLEALGLDGRKYAVEMQTGLMLDNTEAGSFAMTSLSRFLADIGSEKLDVCAMLEGSFREYDASGAFLDLRTVFDDAQLEALSHALVTAEDGRVIGLYTANLPNLQKDGCYDDPADPGILGIVYNTKHLEIAKQYLLYLAGRNGGT